ncbi:hypothetical protein N7495_008977 [Penicillium taxi]|uniref:uncharacterized protein n=1 Tax=Penicillium taxi TaxID=168475 RepID=UPI0025454D5F|nr:uncharacterized protein N7495_008977 [Penicillium taxi]KAJ5888936.1 hypothetical protein N7495_008977 [Penicillium taxi]
MRPQVDKIYPSSNQNNGNHCSVNRQNSWQLQSCRNDSQNAAEYVLWLRFKPYALLCDEFDQWLEEDSMITMIGDSDQLPPIVLSTSEKEEASYYGHLLISCLVDTVYP